MTNAELRGWATAHAQAGSAVAAAVLKLLDRIEPVPDGAPARFGTIRVIEPEKNEAEKNGPEKPAQPFDGSTGTPASGRSSFRSESAGV